MILAAGEGCAVSTARTAVKEAAKHIVGSYEEKRGHKGTSGAAKEAEINNEMLRSKDIWILINTCNWQVGRREKKEEFISN